MQDNTKPNLRNRTESTDDAYGRREFMGRVGVAAATVAVASTGTVSAQESDEGDSRADVDFSTDLTLDPYFAADTVTKEKHALDWGDDDAALLKYEDDSGDVAELGGEVDREDSENVVTLRADKFDAEEYYAFPRDATYDDDGDSDTEEENVTALAATHWATDASGSTGSISVVDDDLGTEHALGVSTSGQASGDVATATFDLTTVASSDATIDSDEEKRYLQAVVNVNSLASGASVELVAIDDDGDEKVAYIDSSKDSSSVDVVATAEGTGIVYQERLGDLTTVTNGDGSYGNIETVEIRVKEADADVTIAGFNLEKKSRWSYGSYLANEDTDDEERTTRYTPSGEFTVTGLDTLGESFSSATLLDVKFPARITFSAADDEFAYEYEFVELDDPTYDYEFVQRGKWEAPAGYDLSYAGLSLLDEVKPRSTRISSVKTASGVEDTSFDDLDDNESWTSQTGSYGSQGTTVTLKDPASAGVVWAYESAVYVTSDERDTILSPASGGGGGPAMQSGGGFFSGASGILMAIVTGIGGYFALLVAKARRAA